MKKVIERIVKSPGSPDTNDMWLDGKLNLKVHDNGEWKTISGGGDSGSGDEGESYVLPVASDTTLGGVKIGGGLSINEGGVLSISGGDSGSGIQIVELTYDHLPATGTLSASDLAKLDSDNCLLVMNGKYFRKTFSSNGGIDYKDIGLTTVLGGVRSIYFTASKPDGEYTIAYTYPVEANTQTQATTALENIKVGNTTYSISTGSVMFVNGTMNDTKFIPNSGEPTWAEAADAFRNGRDIMLIIGPDVFSSDFKIYTRISQLHPSSDNSPAFLGCHIEDYLCYWEDPSFTPMPT